MSISSSSPNSPELSNTVVDGPKFFVVSLRKLIVMTIFTFGMYWIYCFYRNWVLYQRATGEPVIPIVRTVFSIFFIYSLLTKVDRQICLSGRSYAWSPPALVGGLILSTLLIFVTGAPIDLRPIEALVIVSALDVVRIFMIVRIQQAINFCVGDPEGEVNARLSFFNWLWILPGIPAWFLIVAVHVDPGWVSSVINA